MNEVKASSGRIVVLGRRNENLARCVLFDIVEWQRTYGEGSVQLLAQRCQDPTPYPCVVAVENGIVRWEIKAADVAIPGEGHAELQYHVGDVLVKSDIYRTWTLPALGEPGAEPPEPAQDWVDTVLQAAREAEQSAQDARDAVTQTITIGENGNWFIDGEDTGVLAAGKTGDKGDKGDSGFPDIVRLSGSTQDLFLTSNVAYYCLDPVNSLKVSGFEHDDPEKEAYWSISFLAGKPISVDLPDTVVWNYGATPVFTRDREYDLHFKQLRSGKILGVWNEVEA